MARQPRSEILLWGLAAAVVLALAVAAVLGRREEAPALPVLGEVPDFALVGSDGGELRLEDFHGAPWIADFIFTRCVAICPRMTSQMRRVARSLPRAGTVRIASFSVDPEHDTPEVLRAYAEAQGATGEWHFLTGETEAIYSLCQEGFKLAVDASPDPELALGADPIIHSNRFALVDGVGRIRGYYDPFDEGEIERLLRDVRKLLREGPPAGDESLG